MQNEPNPRLARGTGILPVSPNHGQDGGPKRDLSRLGTHAHATIPAARGWEVPPSPVGLPASGLPLGRTHLLVGVNRMGIIAIRANGSKTGSDWED